MIADISNKYYPRVSVFLENRTKRPQKREKKMKKKGFNGKTEMIFSSVREKNI